MTPADLIAAGEALWGQDWRKQMPVHLGVNRVTVWKWENGMHPVPEIAARFLRHLVADPLARPAGPAYAPPMRLAWLTDTHLNFLRDPDAFFASLPDADAFVVTGDVGEAHDVAYHLRRFAERGPTYFVLGNNDYYRGSIAGVRRMTRFLCDEVPNLHWMPEAGVVPLTDSTCLVGHDGWGDGRYGDYWGSGVQLNDWRLIEEFQGLGRQARLDRLNALGNEAADHLRAVLPDALKYRHVVVLTHVPPFREACWHEGKVSDDNWLPHFTCKAVGDVLREAMESSDRQMTVLCGHTHGAGEVQIMPNLRVLTGGAVYGKPSVQRVVEVE